jgi:hypothetical protein
MRYFVMDFIGKRSDDCDECDEGKIAGEDKSERSLMSEDP